MLINHLKKILLILLPLLAILSIYLGFLAYSKSKGISIEINLIMKEEAVFFYKIDHFISKTENIITDVGVFIRENFKTNDPAKTQNFDGFIEDVDQYIKAIMSEDNGFQGAWFVMNPDINVQRKGSSVMLQNYTLTSWYYLGEDKKLVKGPRDNKRLTPEEDPYYFETIKEGKETITNVYTDTDNNTQMISITKPIYKGDQLLGVVGVDINLEKLEVYFREIKDKSSKLNVYLFDSKGSFIIGTQTPSKALIDYALLVMNDNQIDIIKTSLMNDNWVFIESQSSKSPYLAGEISLKEINSNLTFILNCLYTVCVLLLISLVTILIISNISTLNAIGYKTFENE